MTEAHTDPTAVVGPPPDGHGHGQLLNHVTFTARRYACGHIVVEKGHLDHTSHRMVWDLRFEELHEDAGMKPALTLLARAVEHETAELEVPLW